MKLKTEKQLRILDTNNFENVDKKQFSGKIW